MNWSAQVQNIFAAFDEENTNILINACPGAGKTTVLNALWNRVGCPTLYLAFNTGIVAEAKGKLGQKKDSDIATLHSFGFQTLKSKYPYVKVNKWKVSNIVKRLYQSQWSPSQLRERSYDISRVVSVLKNNAIFSYTPSIIRDICYHLDISSYDGIERNVWEVYMSSIDNTKEIDFDDMLTMPVYYHIKPESYALVLVDESQDLNPIQYELLKMMEGRFVFVGDRHQSIYAFRGAMPDGMDLISNHFACVDMPMTLTYRCAKGIVDIAQRYWADDIEALPEAPEGIVRVSTLEGEVFTSADLLLCRNNAPLVKYAFRLLRENIPCFVRGKDIEENLIRWVQHFPAQSNAALYSMASDEIDIEIEIARKKEDYRKAERLEDKLKTLKVFITNCQGKEVSSLIQHIKDMFADGNGMQLSTIHKAKGLEAERVFFLDSHLAETPRKKESTTDVIQRLNVCYIGVTRPKHELVYLYS